MRLSINCANQYCNRKIYLRSTAKTRLSLANTWGTYFFINCPHCKVQGQYHVNNTIAGPSEPITHAPGAIGGVLSGLLVGVLAGPLGMIIGGIGGGVAGGKISGGNEDKAIALFNNYHV
ncbi:MAG TPA: hypothetical protein VK783_11040 [Bacteroidia bacterium]|jgi:hypothetical protein|nr:hypothetical protein [Bacteroidia bacterium]